MRQPDEFNPTPHVPEEVMPGLRRILCDNPSAFTYRGTNTYLIGEGGGIAVVDPGPPSTAHLAGIMGALREGEHISHIFITHAHLDHTPLAADLARQTGAPVLAYGNALAGQSNVMRELSAEGGMGGGEGIDADFMPDETLADGQEVAGDGWRVTALWTPGHQCNHLCFDVDTGSGYGTILTGDHVMGWSSSIVSPPDGDLTQFMQSCRSLRAHPARVHLPGHGAAITDPGARLDWLVAHREQREASILEALRFGPADATGIAVQVYTETPPDLLPAATRNVLAHLIDLAERGRVTTDRPLRTTSIFRLT